VNRSSFNRSCNLKSTDKAHPKIGPTRAKLAPKTGSATKFMAREAKQEKGPHSSGSAGSSKNGSKQKKSEQTHGSSACVG
jgi:hypothetical protein